MAKFRKKPVVIEAFQWLGGEHRPFERICVGRDEWGNNQYNLVIATLEGTMYAKEGDWIITGVAGETYPCKDGIFLATYEPVNANPA